MDTLRIKCPSCGIILEVKNSKNEAVKRITCPNCKKQLAVNFADTPPTKPSPTSQPIAALYEGETKIQLSEGLNRLPDVPAGLVELRVIRLADGGYKHILRALTSEVRLNAQPMQPDDEVVLQRGDKMEIDDKVFSFDKVIPSPKPQKPEKPEQPQKPETPKPQPKADNKPLWPWVLLTAVVLVAFLAVWHFWPTSQPKKEITVLKDSIVTRPSDTIPQAKPARQKSKEPSQPVEKHADLASMDQYSLELLANKNDVNAQFELGKRLVHSSGTRNIIMGINWLQKASRNGSSQARHTLNKALHTLQSKAAQGDSIAIYILNSIDHS